MPGCFSQSPEWDRGVSHSLRLLAWATGHHQEGGASHAAATLLPPRLSPTPPGALSSFLLSSSSSVCVQQQRVVPLSICYTTYTDATPAATTRLGLHRREFSAARDYRGRDRDGIFFCSSRGNPPSLGDGQEGLELAASQLAFLLADAATACLSLRRCLFLPCLLLGPLQASLGAHAPAWRGCQLTQPVNSLFFHWMLLWEGQPSHWEF